MKVRFVSILVCLLNITLLKSQCPDPSGLNASDIGPTSAVLSWISGGAGEWLIRIDTAGYSALTGTIVETNMNPYTLKDLLPETDYNFYVRDVCGDGSFSHWEGPFYFSTSAHFTSVNSGIPDMNYTLAEWGDYDNDGDLDIILSGLSFGSTIKIYQNNNTDSFLEINTGIPCVIYGSVSWGDYDNDGDLDLAVTGDRLSGWEKTSAIYRNDGGNTFVNLNLALTPVEYGSATWADFDNDGDLDLLLVGESALDNIGKIYINNGNDVFVDGNVKIKACANGTIAVADYNKDNYLDIIMSGTDVNGNKFTMFFVNEGNLTFSEFNPGFKGSQQGSLVWGDYDQDGDPDLFMSGEIRNEFISVIYRNDGNNVFTDIKAGIIPVNNSYAEWGDFDNDGDLDLVLSGNGFVQYAFWTKIYRNDGSDLFTELKVNLSGVARGVSMWGDYDLDGDLDLFVSGEDSLLNSKITRLYRNNILFSNNKPVPPSDLISHDGISPGISWAPGSDSESSQKGLSYNLRVGTSISAYDIVSPMSDVLTGYRRIVKEGNMNQDTSWILHGLNPGKYYWSLQTLDNSYEASLFSPVDSFNVLPAFSLIDAGLHQIREGEIDWGDYDNDNDLDILLSGTYYIADSGKYIGETCIYQNELNDVFTRKTEISLTGVSDGSSRWADYDNDGDLDIILTGAYEQYPVYNPVSKIYRNNGNRTFSEIIIDLPESPFSTGDYDNDGDIDIFCQGKIYRNENGNFIYTSISTLGTIGAWGDYDNDGDLDLLSAGYGFVGIFRNDGGNIFTKLNNNSLQGGGTSISWGDIDNDMDLDVFLTGYDYNYDVITSIHRNDGDDVFTDINSDIRSVGSGNISLGDYNNDGWLDILITGLSGIPITKIYQNNKDLTFTEIDTDFIGLRQGHLSWSDYDNDGDLDVSMVGIDDDYINISRIYRNNINRSKTAPPVPQSLKSESYKYGIKLSWSMSPQVQNIDAGYTYNVRIGTTAGGNEILSSLSDNITGFRRVTAMGNAQVNNFCRLDTLPEGKYFWSVQAIDQTFNGGAWAPEQTFNISVVRADFDADTVCFRMSTSFTDRSLTSGTVINGWQWDFGDGSTSTDQNPSHVYAASGSYLARLIAKSSDYSDTLTKSVLVLQKPTADFFVDPVCHGTPSTIVNSSSANGLTIATWEWDFGDSQTSLLQNPPAHFYAKPDNYETKLRIIASNGCSDTLTKISRVGEYPVVILSSDGPTEFCEGKSVNLSVENKVNYSYQWNLNDLPLTDAKSYFLNVNTSGTFSVSVTNTVANCLSSSPKTNVLVTEKPEQPVINYSGQTDGFCPDDENITFNIDQASSLYNYQWKRNGIPIDNATETSYNGEIKSGIYSVSASVSGCAIESNEIEVTPKEAFPKPELYVRGPVVWYMASSNDTANSYIWYLNNEVIQGADRFIYVANQTLGTYRVAIRNKAGCTTMSDEITIPVSKSGMKDFRIPDEFLVKDSDPFAGLKIYPNPTPGMFNIEMDNKIMGMLDIAIATQAGREILKIRFEKTTEHFLTQVDLSGQPDGLYIINLLIDRYAATRKIIVE